MRFRIIQQVEPPSRRPFQIVESINTVDGIRSRLCNGMFDTIEEARAIIEGKPDPLRVLVEVSGGIADVTQCPKGTCA